MKTCGNLYIIATPLGHNNDITLEAIETLNTIDIIAAENISTNKNRIQKFLTNKNQLWIPYYDGNEITQSLKIIKLLKDGKNICLISSSGTPIISDPGYKLIQLAYKYNINLIPVTGSCSVIGALCISGAKPFPFTFWGFFPKKINKKFLDNILFHTHIFFESSHRILSTISNLFPQLSCQQQIILIKDLNTKFFQRIVINENNYNNFSPNGQWVIIINNI
jgi:16S rRNA (cytidine1402-2'-O)-methyltransferase